MTTREAIAAILPKQQAAYLNQLLKEAKTADAMAEVGAVLDCVLVQAKNYLATPALYATDGKPADQRKVYLHYFCGGSDWFVLEKGSGEDLDTAYGVARITDSEWGYMSFKELTAKRSNPLATPELDFYWKPCTLAEVIQKFRLDDLAV